MHGWDSNQNWPTVRDDPNGGQYGGTDDESPFYCGFWGTSGDRMATYRSAHVFPTGEIIKQDDIIAHIPIAVGKNDPDGFEGHIVESIDAMTANFAKLDWSILEQISTRIINEVKGINRVVYDISNKPPATIEFE